jgi:hypothetical protein
MGVHAIDQLHFLPNMAILNCLMHRSKQTMSSFGALSTLLSPPASPTLK